MDVKTIAEMWKKNGGDLVPPKIFLAYDSEDKKYFVVQDYGAIVYMVVEKSNITYTIPKKYLTVIDDKYYKINNSNKMISVTCRARNKYEKFVEKFLN